MNAPTLCGEPLKSASGIEAVLHDSHGMADLEGLAVVCYFCILKRLR
jgi:hypothetical protein